MFARTRFAFSAVLVSALLAAAVVVVAEAEGEPAGEEGAFEHDLELEEEETGGKLRLQSKGKLSKLVDLDRIPSVKRVLCKGSKILVALKKDEPDVSWSPSQIILGNQTWGCAMNALKPGATSIYARITEVKRPKKYVVEVHTEPAGPLDMLEDASISVHYEQGGRHAPSRRRRYMTSSNHLRKSLNNIDWNVTFADRNIPFNQDEDGDAERVVNVFKKTGKFYPAADTDVNATADGKDFLFTCWSCHGYSNISYHFELRIKKNPSTNVAEIQRYKMQLDMNTHIQHNYSLYADKEVTLTTSDVLWQTPPTNVFQAPVAMFKEFPPIVMSVNVSDQANVFLTSMTKNVTQYDGAFTLDGKTAISESFEIGDDKASEITSYDWTVTAGEQNVDANSTFNASYAVHQNMTITPRIYWDLRDVDMTFGSPIKISIRPRVNVVSTSDSVARCDRSVVSVDSNVSVDEADFKVDSHGIKIWDVKLRNAVAKKFQLLVKEPLMSTCHADCHVPADLLTPGENDTMDTVCGIPSGTILRGDSRFSKFHQLWGDFVTFASDNGQPSWCSEQSRTCPDCTSHSASASLDDACAERIVNPDLAASMSRLAKLVHAEWPDRKMVVRQTWDEPTSDHPDGRHGPLSAFNEGRATEVELTEPVHGSSAYTIENSPDILQRFAELGVCSRFKYVKQTDTKTSMCVEKVVTSGVRKRSLLSRKRRSGHVEHDMVEETLQSIDAGMQEAITEGIIPADPAPLGSGETHPSQTDMAQACGQFEGRITQDDVARMKRLVEFPLDTVSFGPEGGSAAGDDSWCGVETRACRACTSPGGGGGADTWGWCGTRTMAMRLAIRLQRLASLTGGQVLVQKALSQNDTDGSSDLYKEGRAARLSPTPSSAMTIEAFTSKAILAGFDFVKHSSSDFIEVCVKPQDGIQAHVVQLPLTTMTAVPLPLGEEAEYDYPAELAHEFRKPMLYDISTSSNVISKHFKLSHLQSPGQRYIRLDNILMDLLELAYDNFPGGFYVIPGSGFRPRSVNVDNIDTRHPKETFRYQMGQAFEIKPNTVATEDKLFDLAIALVKAGKTVRDQRIGVGFGCKADRLYFEIRPMADEDSNSIEVWDSGSPSLYGRLKKIETLVAEGGSVVSASSDPVNCASPKLGVDHFYFNFDLDEEGYCWSESGAEFCAKTREHRHNKSVELQRRLTSAAGSLKLPAADIRDEIAACAVDTCGGCPSAGATWNQKVIACTRMILKYLSRASVPFQPLKDNVAVFNTENHASAAHAQACDRSRVCVENTNIYSLLLPLVTATFREDNVEELLYGGADNPMPLLEIVEQELSWRAEGRVQVYLDTAKDVNTMRNVIKILLMYNPKVDHVTFHLDPDTSEEEVATALQTKVEAWSGAVCPGRSRIVTTPYSLESYHHSVKKRSLEMSRDRNQMTRDMRNWEIDWMLKS